MTTAKSLPVSSSFKYSLMIIFIIFFLPFAPVKSQMSSASWPLPLMSIPFHPNNHHASIWPLASASSPGHRSSPMTEPFLRPVPLPEVQLAFPLSHPLGQFTNSLPIELPTDDEMQFNYERNRARLRAKEKEKMRKQKIAIEKLTKATIEKLEQEQSNSNPNSKSNIKKSTSNNSLEPMSPSGSTASELSMNQEEMKNETEKLHTLAPSNLHQVQQQQQEPTRRNHHISHYDPIDGKSYLNDPRYIETMPPDPPKKPVDIKRKTIPMPNGQVTYITEMLYDIEDDTGHGNHFKATRPPTVAQFLPPSNDDIFPPTENPRQINSHSTSSLPPSTTVPSFTLPSTTMAGTTTGRSTDRTTDRRSTESWASLPTPPPPYKMTTIRSSSTTRGSNDDSTTRRELSTTSTITSRSLRTSTSTSEYPRFRQLDEEAHQSRRHNVTKSNGHKRRFRPDASDSMDKTWRSETDGLGAAAIAGIVIGSLVSITLLAGKY